MHLDQWDPVARLASKDHKAFKDKETRVPLVRKVLRALSASSAPKVSKVPACWGHRVRKVHLVCKEWDLRVGRIKDHKVCKGSLATGVCRV